MDTEETQAPQVAAGTQVDPRTIYCDPGYQVRALDEATVRRYADAMKAGEVFPPIVLTVFDGVLTLLCGWHRVAAAKISGHQLPAVTVETTRTEAHWIAARDNLRNSLPLKGRKDKREVFRRYVTARQHHRPSGKLKSYEEIVTDLAGIAVKATLWNWMKKDYPSVARVMGGLHEKPRNPNPEMCRAPSAEAQAVAVIGDWAAQAATLQRAVADPVTRGRLRQTVLNLVKVIEVGGAWSEPDF